MRKRGGGRPPRRGSRGGKGSGGGGRESRPGPGPIGLTRVQGRLDQFELVHPPCVEESELDYEEGLELWKAGDPEEARDALRYALQACHDNLWVHVALGRLALEEFHDPELARGHFGYAVELAKRAIPPGFSGLLPRDRPANQPFFQAVAGLAQCFRALGMAAEANGLTALADRLGGSTAAEPGR